MIRHYLMKYIVFLVILIVCLGVVWYFTDDADGPYKDAVLAGVETFRGMEKEDIAVWARYYI